MLSQMEDVDILDRMVTVRWAILLRSMEAWTIQLFICLMSKDPLMSKGLMEHLFPFAHGNCMLKQGLTTTHWYDKHFVKNLEAVLVVICGQSVC